MEAKVYYVALANEASPKVQAKAMGRLFEAADVSNRISRRDLVAIKIHVGERGNKTYVRPELVREIVKRVKDTKAFPFLTETSTLYKGQRDNAVKHLLLAHGHGFSVERVGAPFIMADGLMGNTQAEVEIHGGLHRSVKVAREIVAADALLVISHATGHIGTGFAGCIKNLGMGLSSRAGKIRQHSAIRPVVDPKRCQLCRNCHPRCPTEAVRERHGASFIIQELCIGCGECIAVCRSNAIRFDFGRESAELQKNIAEHAYAVVKGKIGKCFFFNVLVNMTRHCDCFGGPQQRIIEDIGILGSDDPVAVDKAALDLTREKVGSDLSYLSHPQIDPMMQLAFGEHLGMGTTRYTLEMVGQAHVQDRALGRGHT